MRLLASLLLIWSSHALALGAYQNSAHPNFPHPPVLAENLGDVLTFWTPLNNTTKAWGAGSNAATYSGGVVSGAGASLYLQDPFTNLLTSRTSGVAQFEPNGYASYGAINNQAKDSIGLVNSWTATGLSTPPSTVPGILGPDGVSTTYAALSVDGTTAIHGKGFALSGLTTGAAGTLSIYAKAGGYSFICLAIGDGKGAGIRQWYNLGTHATGTGAVTGSASNFWISAASVLANQPNGYDRLILTSGTMTGTVESVTVYACSADNTLSFAGSAGSSVFVWGVQYEDNSTFAKPLIVTAGAVGTVTGNNLTYNTQGNVPSSAPMSVVCSADAFGTDNAGDTIVSSCDNSGTNGWRLFWTTGNWPRYTYPSVAIVSGQAYAIRTSQALGVSVNSSNFHLYSKGLEVGTPNTSASLAAAQTFLSFGARGPSGTNNIAGHVARTYVFAVPLSGSDMAPLTARPN